MPMCVQSSEFNITVHSGNIILLVELVSSKQKKRDMIFMCKHPRTCGCDLSSYNSPEMEVTSHCPSPPITIPWVLWQFLSRFFRSQSSTVTAQCSLCNSIKLISYSHFHDKMHFRTFKLQYTLPNGHKRWSTVSTSRRGDGQVITTRFHGRHCSQSTWSTARVVPYWIVQYFTTLLNDYPNLLGWGYFSWKR